MKARIVEVSNPDKAHPTDNDKRNHILWGQTRTYCGLTDFKGEGVMMELGEVANLCGNCRRRVGG